MKKIALLICSLMILLPSTSNSMKNILKEIRNLNCIPKLPKINLKKINQKKDDSLDPKSTETQPLKNDDNESTTSELSTETKESENPNQKEEKKIEISEKPQEEGLAKTLTRVVISTTLGLGIGHFFGDKTTGALQGFIGGLYLNKDNTLSNVTRSTLIVGAGSYKPMKKYYETGNLTIRDAGKSLGFTAINSIATPMITDSICEKLFD